MKRMYWTSCKVLIITAIFKETWIFSTDFRKILKYPNSYKMRPVGAAMFHADGQT